MPAARRDPNFGTLLPESNLDPALLSGWGNRSFDWQTGVAVQQRCCPVSR